MSTVDNADQDVKGTCIHSKFHVSKSKVSYNHFNYRTKLIKIVNTLSSDRFPSK